MCNVHHKKKKTTWTLLPRFAYTIAEAEICTWNKRRHLNLKTKRTLIASVWNRYPTKCRLPPLILITDYLLVRHPFLSYFSKFVQVFLDPSEFVCEGCPSEPAIQPSLLSLWQSRQILSISFYRRLTFQQEISTFPTLIFGLHRSTQPLQMPTLFLLCSECF